MKRILIAAAAASVSILMTAPVSAQLLGSGGLLGDTGLGSTVGGLVNTVGGTVGGLVGDSDGNVLGGLVETGNGINVNVSGLATVGVDSGGNVNATVLGGGNPLNLPLDGLIGGLPDINLDLPDLGGLLPGSNGGNGTPGTPGAPGKPGSSGVNGSNGGNGSSGGIDVFVRGGSNSGVGLAGIRGSSKLQLLMRIMEARAWLRFAQGNKVCLPPFGVASVGGWLPQGDMKGLQRLLAAYGQDIKTLQSMMTKCRGSNQAVNMGRVIGVDLRKDGTVVVFTL